jgi:uncharacterized protein DUF222/HNH endonuclease
MLERFKELIAEFGREVAALDETKLSASEATELIEASSEGERFCQAARAVGLKRAFRDRPWHGAGYKTAAAWLAAKSKKTLSSAIATVNTAWHLEKFPQTREAFVSGEISEIQAAQITEAAVADPASEQGLLELAARESVGALKERCREVKAAAFSDEDAAQRIRDRRYCRHWADKDGAIRLDACLSPDDAAPLVAAIDRGAALMAEEAKRSGQREPLEAYAADALVALAKRQHGPTPVLHIHADASALERGFTKPGERCVIEGIGPVPVSSARRLAADGIVKVVLTDRADVTAVAHLGRVIPAKLRTALEARDPTCVVPGCDVRLGLEIDHITPLSKGGVTELSNLARLCRYHHGQKTHHGAHLSGQPGAWTWTPRRTFERKSRTTSG